MNLLPKALRAKITLPNNDSIIDIEDKSDSMMNRVRVHFKNGYELSIIQGEYSYGGDVGLFEIAPYNKEGEMDGSILSLGDDIEGYLTAQQVQDYILEIGNKE